MTRSQRRAQVARAGRPTSRGHGSCQICARSGSGREATGVRSVRRQTLALRWPSLLAPYDLVSASQADDALRSLADQEGPLRPHTGHTHRPDWATGGRHRTPRGLLARHDLRAPHGLQAGGRGFESHRLHHADRLLRAWSAALSGARRSESCDRLIEPSCHARATWSDPYTETSTPAVPSSSSSPELSSPAASDANSASSAAAILASASVVACW
jgi:hypothetical protein